MIQYVRPVERKGMHIMKDRNTFTILAALVLVFAFAATAYAETYYWVGPGNSSERLDHANYWNTATDGSGATASELTASDTCIIGTSPSGAITLSGDSASNTPRTFAPKLKVEADATITYGSSKALANFTGGIEVDAEKTLTLQSGSTTSFGITQGDKAIAITGDNSSYAGIVSFVGSSATKVFTNSIESSDDPTFASMTSTDGKSLTLSADTTKTYNRLVATISAND